MTDPIKVHITGVYGLIGNLVYKHLSQWPEHYELYGSGRRQASSRRADEDGRIELPDDRFCIADISDAWRAQRFPPQSSSGPAIEFASAITTCP